MANVKAIYKNKMSLDYKNLLAWTTCKLECMTS